MLKLKAKLRLKTKYQKLLLFLFENRSLLMKINLHLKKLNYCVLLLNMTGFARFLILLIP
jgi:hypothetical protein